VPARPPEDPRATGFRQAWASAAPAWARATRRLIASEDEKYLQLAAVALHMCLTYCVKLVAGHRNVYGDEPARADSPSRSKCCAESVIEWRGCETSSFT
jgi:hypothetical protein